MSRTLPPLRCPLGFFLIPHPLRWLFSPLEALLLWTTMVGYIIDAVYDGMGGLLISLVRVRWAAVNSPWVPILDLEGSAHSSRIALPLHTPLPIPPVITQLFVVRSSTFSTGTLAFTCLRTSVADISSALQREWRVHDLSYAVLKGGDDHVWG